MAGYFFFFHCQHNQCWEPRWTQLAFFNLKTSFKQQRKPESDSLRPKLEAKVQAVFSCTNTQLKTKWISKSCGIQLDHTLLCQVHTKNKVCFSNVENEMNYPLKSRNLKTWQPWSWFSQSQEWFSHLFQGHIHVVDLLQVNVFMVCSLCPRI